jgi:hypothetical protein
LRLFQKRIVEIRYLFIAATVARDSGSGPRLRLLTADLFSSLAIRLLLLGSLPYSRSFIFLHPVNWLGLGSERGIFSNRGVRTGVFRFGHYFFLPLPFAAFFAAIFFGTSRAPESPAVRLTPLDLSRAPDSAPLFDNAACFLLMILPLRAEKQEDCPSALL